MFKFNEEKKILILTLLKNLIYMTHRNDVELNVMILICKWKWKDYIFLYI